jgi:hypothetical protein
LRSYQKISWENIGNNDNNNNNDQLPLAYILEEEEDDDLFNERKMDVKTKGRNKPPFIIENNN